MKRKKRLLVLTLIITSCSLPLFINLFSNNELAKIKDYRIYYREIDDRIIDELGNYDMVIVEGLHFNDEDVKEVKKNNTIVLGYISIMEIGEWDDDILGQLEASDYLYVDDKKVIFNEKFMGDISKEHYQDILIKTLSSRALSKGMDGVFLDTLDCIDDYINNQEIYNRLLRGYEQFLIKLTKAYQDIYIVQNRGFENLSMSSQYIDGVLWEDFNVEEVNKWTSVQERVDFLNELKTKKDFVILTVSYDNEQESRKFTKKMGWINFQNNSRQYSDWDEMNKK